MTTDKPGRDRHFVHYPSTRRVAPPRIAGDRAGAGRQPGVAGRRRAVSPLDPGAVEAASRAADAALLETRLPRAALEPAPADRLALGLRRQAPYRAADRPR